MSISITETVSALVAVALVARLLFGNRPTAARFLAAQELRADPDDVAAVAATLARVYRGRLVGGTVGVLVGAAGGGFLGARFTIGGAIVGLLVGTLVGIAFAQSPRHAASRTQRRASLVARQPSEYRSRSAQWARVVLAALVVASAAIVIVSADGGLGRNALLVAFALATLGALPLGWRLERRTVELRRDEVGGPAVLVDDALRTTAVRALQHATVGILCCGLLALGIAAVETQTFLGVEADGHVLLRTSIGSHSMNSTPVGAVIASGVHSLMRWSGPDGSAHESTITVPQSGMTIGSLVDNDVIWTLGAWTSIIALVAALAEWGRAANAWRRPARSRGAAIGASAIATGA